MRKLKLNPYSMNKSQLLQMNSNEKAEQHQSTGYNANFIFKLLDKMFQRIQ
jgi:hypothetical protein